MKKSIFTVYVPITDGQTQCNRLKQICTEEIEYFNTRPEATEKAIEKANEIFNNK